jgi:hypothetical protein
MNKTYTNAEAEKIIRRFDYLRKMITKYAHRWEYESPRLYGWVDEYNILRSENIDIFNRYCERFGLCKEHNGYDGLA